VSVLEGGYSDRALISGAMAHLCGLVSVEDGKVGESWWNVENLEKVMSNASYRFIVAKNLDPHSWRNPPRNGGAENSL
jgi:acetoin utilization deacetylase AcuC-like enzyme